VLPRSYFLFQQSLCWDHDFTLNNFTESNNLGFLLVNDKVMFTEHYSDHNRKQHLGTCNPLSYLYI
jgi:hypothetical protein